MQPQYQDYAHMVDNSARNSAISKPQMSAIREVSSVSNDKKSSHNATHGNLSKASQDKKSNVQGGGPDSNK